MKNVFVRQWSNNNSNSYFELCGFMINETVLRIKKTVERYPKFAYLC